MREPVWMRSIAASLVVVLTATAGCSLVAPADVEPIESQAEALFGQVQFDLEIEDIILLNPYLDEHSPKSDAFEVASSELFSAAELLVDYSIELIELLRLESDRAIVAEFVQLMRGFHEDLVELPGIQRHLNTVDIEAISQDAADQRNLTLALRVVGPVHASVADAIRASIVEAEDLLQAAFNELYNKIIDEFAPFMAYWDNLTIRHNRVLDKLLLLDAAREGAADSWQSLLSGDEPLRSKLGDGAAPTPAMIDEAEAILVMRLANLVEIWGHLQPALTNYQAVLRELYTVQSNANSALQIASVVIDSWDSAQRQLAAGQRPQFVAVTQDLLSIAIRRNLRRR